MNKKDSTLPAELCQAIHKAINKLEGWGSVEIFVQDGRVTQITQKAIHKINQPIQA